MASCRWLASITLVIALTGSLPGGPAIAETVLLTRGDNDFGLGWLFLDRDGRCRVATPRHVIEAEDGRLVAPDLLDSFGRQHGTARPVAPADPDVDLAFLDVLGQLPKHGCSKSRVAATSLQAFVDRMEQASLSIATPFERQIIVVERRASSRDASGGSVIAISPAEGAEAFHKGMSGGAVVLAGRPVAMLTEVDPDSGVGIALRFDVIAKELQALSVTAMETPVAATAMFGHLTVLQGSVAAADAGIGQFLSGGGALQLAPEKDRVVVLLSMAQRMVVQGVRIEGLATAGQPVFVEIADGASGFLFAQRCSSGPALECRFSPRRLDQIKLTFTGGPEDIVRIGSLSPL